MRSGGVYACNGAGLGGRLFLGSELNTGIPPAQMKVMLVSHYFHRSAQEPLQRMVMLGPSMTNRMPIIRGSVAERDLFTSLSVRLCIWLQLRGIRQISGSCLFRSP